MKADLKSQILETRYNMMEFDNYSDESVEDFLDTYLQMWLDYKDNCPNCGVLNMVAWTSLIVGVGLIMGGTWTMV